MSKNIDYLKLHKYLIEIGQLGEAFVYDYEREKLKDTKYYDFVDNTKALDNKNGYDILSYDKSGQELFIEVKTEASLNGNCFYITHTEKEVGKKLIDQGKKYLIYRVHNILAKDKREVSLEIIEDIFNENKYRFEEDIWKVYY